ncbi:hypothetical protein [Roseibium alexandrii]|uniref:Uncharacterized protein n=1 Tax=Roseibium alexandrii (strain DSM 17067 / NCIMB 14079 / DFL-11) TaxID=244592 RepID=A0A5E8GV34_ROSAD|nr:hypothetical protein [Roseibium alexandrii]EEE43421.2 hypothetical protein SADFL11_707 [Roseibium alexandrii DFL-11]
MTKTFKREVAVTLFGFLMLLCIFDLLTGGETTAYQWAELLALPIFGFGVAAFGLDAAAKQLPIGGQGMRDTDPNIPPKGYAE